jgi:hypothetical protein
MLFEAVIGCGSLNPCRLLADYLQYRAPASPEVKHGKYAHDPRSGTYMGPDTAI